MPQYAGGTRRQNEAAAYSDPNGGAALYDGPGTSTAAAAVTYENMSTTTTTNNSNFTMGEGNESNESSTDANYSVVEVASPRPAAGGGHETKRKSSVAIDKR